MYFDFAADFSKTSLINTFASDDVCVVIDNYIGYRLHKFKYTNVKEHIQKYYYLNEDGSKEYISNSRANIAFNSRHTHVYIDEDGFEDEIHMTYENAVRGGYIRKIMYDTEFVKYYYIIDGVRTYCKNKLYIVDTDGLIVNLLWSSFRDIKITSEFNDAEALLLYVEYPFNKIRAGNERYNVPYSENELNLLEKSAALGNCMALIKLAYYYLYIHSNRVETMYLELINKGNIIYYYLYAKYLCEVKKSHDMCYKYYKLGTELGESFSSQYYLHNIDNCNTVIDYDERKNTMIKFFNNTKDYCRILIPNIVYYIVTYCHNINDLIELIHLLVNNNKISTLIDMIENCDIYIARTSDEKLIQFIIYSCLYIYDVGFYPKCYEALNNMKHTKNCKEYVENILTQYEKNKEVGIDCWK